MRHILFASLFLSLAGCAPSSATLAQPQGVAGLNAYGQPAAPEQVALAVRQGVIAARWAIVADEPGAVTAQVHSGGHYATVRIEYNPGGWVVLHQDSSPGLRFNPNYRGRAVIHHRYNLWVDRLNRHIERALREQQGATPTTTRSVGVTW